ncbi:ACETOLACTATE SYNTHASE ISOZYME II (LARGE SUBUNIT) PROTEIN [Cupriavidus taiwanensis]|uniref:thiamine pyrophosphate-binding protein n=1 Tax=Cupriavidus taiwanensis TaxID=164546 RepID=UPI000E1406EB|nr:ACETOLACTATE SYNTHASE ISOZYME II (LARGE SUBUNIT) PROTEIN [Cupriavidus taiwanensis]SOY81626.1 ACETOLACTATE SYNTHASE ISOZYME II (LARGE SUBUNIT) PROTEIN [Cupriavidus taiwanensis]
MPMTPANATQPEDTDRGAPLPGGHILVDALLAHGAELAFGVPGESYLAVLDGFHRRRDQLRFIVCRQEGGAAVMAEAYGKLTGRPGLAFCTRGPGATNASIGVHTAFQDSTPMILFIGQVGTDFMDREAFQEIDYRRMFGQMAKWVAQIDRVERIPEYIARAYQTATSGRPGPVVLALPEDMLAQTAAVPQLQAYQRVMAWPGEAELARLTEMLHAAERPFVLAGGSGWTPQACADLQAFAERFALPVGCAFRGQDLFDNHHPNYAGDVGIGINPALAERIRNADLVLAIGPRLGEMTTGGYALIEAPRPAQTLVHVHAGAEELGSVYQADLMIQASMPAIAARLAGLQPLAAPRWQDWTEAAHADYERYLQPPPFTAQGVDMAEVIRTLDQLLPADAVVTNGAGNYAGWLHRYFHYRPFTSGGRGQLAPTSGAMGYGVPAAVGAKIAFPQRTVVALAGDGCFLMNGQELATSMQYGAPVIIIVVNNGMYGTIRMHQEREYPTHVSGTELLNPDFAALARAYGARGVTVTTTGAFAPALREALAAPVSTLIEIQVDPDVITPRTTLSAIRAQALASQKP